jgi:hypothetical protein
MSKRTVNHQQAQDAIEKIRRGFADMNASRTVSLATSQARIEALLAVRHGNGSALADTLASQGRPR